MYTTTILSTSKANGQLRVVVAFSNGVTTTEREFQGNYLEEIKSFIRSEKERLEAVEALTVNIGVIETTLPVVVKTIAEIDKDIWFRKYNRWFTVKTRLIDTGILTGSEPQVANLKAEVQAGFKPVYLGDL